MANGKRNGGDNEHDEPVERVEIIQATALVPFNREEIDLQIATAKRFPRVITDFKREATMLATADEDTAASMFYNLERDGKIIEGPSVRLAEVAVYCFRNLRVGARQVAEEEKFVVSEGAALDLERNIGVSIQVTRRITGRTGRRFGDDMIGVTKNAAAAIAYREVTWKIIPRVYIQEIYEKAKKVAVGEGTPMKVRIQKILDWYGKLGAKPETVWRIVGRKGVDDLEPDDVLKLMGFQTAIKDGETTLEQVLRNLEERGTTVRPESLGAVVSGATVEAQNNAPPSYPRASGPAPTPPTEGGDPFTRF